MGVFRLRKLSTGAPITWLLRDEFKDTLAAGSVNGTLATPGPGTRTVTGNTISIGSDVLNFATGETANDAVWYGTITRTAGRILLAKLILSEATNGIPAFGWDSAASGAILDMLKFSASGALQVIPNGGTKIAVGAYTGTTYHVSAIMRGTGIYWFIKGGAFTKWTLLWITAAGTAAGFPAIQSFNTTAVFTCDFIRVPTNLYIPSPLVYDAFGRENGALGTSETSGEDSQSVVARTWTGTTWAIATNVAVNTPTLGGELATGNLVVGTWYEITATQANYFYTGCAIGHTFRAAATTALDANNKVKAITLATLFATCGDLGTSSVVASDAVTLTAGNQGGKVLNLDSAAGPANFLIAYHNGTNAVLDKCLAGTYTNLISAAATYSAGKLLRVIKDGVSVSLYYNDVQIGTTQTLTSPTDDAIINGMIYGMFATDATVSLDTFMVFPRGNEGQYSIQDKYIR